MLNNKSPTKKFDKGSTLKEYKKEDHDEHAPESVRDSEMASEMVNISSTNVKGGDIPVLEASTPLKGNYNKLMLENDDVNHAPFQEKTRQYDIEPREEKGDDEGGDDHSAHSFDDDDHLEDDHVKKFDTLRVKVGLSWENVSIKCADTKVKGKVITGRTILDNVSGCAASGEFISIIGASGAGKTTLLNHLSGRLLATNLMK